MLPLVGVHQGYHGLFVVCFFVYLQSPVVSSVIEYDPVVMVSSPRPLPPVHDLKQLGLPSSLTQASVHTRVSVRSCMRVRVCGWVSVCVCACMCAYVGVWVWVYIHTS